jgi:SpoVK/Ycf46/Vps4 family AAA+-type ATPase
MAKAVPFQNSLEHIFAEMKRLDLMLRRAVVLARSSRSSDVPDEFRGLVISENNVDQLLDSVDFLGDIWKMDDATRRTVESIDEELEGQWATIRARMEASDEAEQKLALPHLAGSCGLSPAEVDVLLIALAPELEPRYETLYAYLQNDVTRKRPTVDLSLNLICRTEQEKVQARDIFSLDSPLLHFGIVELHEESYDRKPTLLRRFVKMSDSVTRFLLERQSEGGGEAQLKIPEIAVEDLETSAQTRQELQNLVSALLRGGSERTVIQLWGNGEALLKEAAEALANKLGRTLLYVELSRLEPDASKLGGLARDVALWDNLLVVDRGADDNLAEAEREKRARTERKLWERIGESEVPVVVLNAEEQFGSLPTSTRLWRVKVDPPDYATRREAWQESLAGVVTDLDADRLADLFPFSGKGIRQIASLTATRSALRNPDVPNPQMSDVLAAARDLTTPNLQRFALMIEPRYGWDDLVLPEDRMRQLHAIASRLRFRSIVHRDWDLGKKLARGRGLSVLFSGPTGAGKTMAADVLASELSLHLFQIDLSTVVSKYIGETERNLSAIFHEAELSQSLLFFDEADALFGKRTEVKDAHDRYANIEVNYLLQRIEQYEGLVVLATNFQKNLDEAFLRRLHHVVEFPFPDEDARERIWRLHLAGKAPKADDLDYGFLASQFQLSGGSIRNVVVEAAFLAAEEKGVKGPISIGHIIEALKHEYQKQGKLVMKTDLGRYAHVI